MTLRKDMAGSGLEEEAGAVAGTGVVVMVGVSSQKDKEPKAKRGRQERKYD